MWSQSSQQHLKTRQIPNIVTKERFSKKNARFPMDNSDSKVIYRICRFQKI